MSEVAVKKKGKESDSESYQKGLGREASPGVRGEADLSPMAMSCRGGWGQGQRLPLSITGASVGHSHSPLWVQKALLKVPSGPTAVRKMK